MRRGNSRRSSDVSSKRTVRASGAPRSCHASAIPSTWDFKVWRIQSPDGTHTRWANYLSVLKVSLLTLHQGKRVCELRISSLSLSFFYFISPYPALSHYPGLSTAIQDYEHRKYCVFSSSTSMISFHELEPCTLLQLLSPLLFHM